MLWSRTKPKPLRWIVPALAAAIALGLAPMTVAAQAPGTQPATSANAAEPIAQWVSELASSDAPTRAHARLHLMLLDRNQLPELRRAVEQELPLSPAQKAALPRIVREVFLSGEPYEKKVPRQGFLGILMDLTALEARDFPGQQADAGAPGVVVADRIPGFCASRRLLDGDVLLGLAHSPHLFRGPQDLKLAIGGLAPGTTITLLVLRHGQVIQVPLTLDAYPEHIEDDFGQTFRRKRAEQFASFWRQYFAPLIKNQELTATPQANAGK